MAYFTLLEKTLHYSEEVKEKHDKLVSIHHRNNFCGGKNPSNDVLIEWKMWALNIHHSNSDFFKMDLVIDSNCNVNQTITASLLFFKSNGNQFLGNLSDLNSVLFTHLPSLISHAPFSCVIILLQIVSSFPS